MDFVTTKHDEFGDHDGGEIRGLLEDMPDNRGYPQMPTIDSNGLEASLDKKIQDPLNYLDLSVCLHIEGDYAVPAELTQQPAPQDESHQSFARELYDIFQQTSNNLENSPPTDSSSGSTYSNLSSPSSHSQNMVPPSHQSHQLPQNGSNSASQAATYLKRRRRKKPEELKSVLISFIHHHLTDLRL